MTETVTTKAGEEVQRFVDCPPCDGFGDCPYCDGEEGGCHACGFTGTCLLCNGTGDLDVVRIWDMRDA